MSTKTTATVRMYRLNELGDCFLIMFAVGTQKRRMLIDCGSFRNGGPSIKRLGDIVAHIKAEVGDDGLDVVVGTHQHNDHVNGFVHCKEAFRKIGIGQVWLSWLDDPSDRTARRIGNDHNNLMVALSDVRKQLGKVRLGRRGQRSLSMVDDVLGFYQAKDAGPPQLPAKAIENLKGLGKQQPKYLRPGDVFDMPGLPDGSVKVYVLGPPRDDELLYRKDPRKGESYDHALAARLRGARRFFAAVGNRRHSVSDEERHYPFSEVFKYEESGKRRGSTSRSPLVKTVVDRYRKGTDAWRTIDDDWLEQAEALALYLDTYTNNSSLVLAIELVESGKVLLFAADAQTGNWLSWPDVKWKAEGVSTDDLLARTILYKVGHHGSHNSTLKDAFEKMVHPDLVALIPVHKRDPNIAKPNGWKMPASNLFQRLRERTSNRVLRMDGDEPDPRKKPAARAWKDVHITPKVDDLFFELEISG